MSTKVLPWKKNFHLNIRGALQTETAKELYHNGRIGNQHSTHHAPQSPLATLKKSNNSHSPHPLKNNGPPFRLNVHLVL